MSSMLKLKKILVCSLALLLLAGWAVFVAEAATTGDVIGVIDSQFIITRHPAFEQTMRELQQLMRQKENEARLAVEAESDQAKRAQIMQTKRMEALREEQRLMEPIYNVCQEAVRVVARQRNVTVVLEKASVYFGGHDLTDFVIQQFNR